MQSLAVPAVGGPLPTPDTSATWPRPRLLSLVALVLAALIGSSPATCTTLPAGSGYAVDSTLGNDSNPGTQDKPWRTLQRAAAAKLAPGQGLFLRCGRVWRETVDLGSAQLSDGAIISAYGDNCDTARPRITGADDLSGSWTRSGNVWSRKVPGGTKVTRLFVNGAPMTLAQWPNATEVLPLAAGATTSGTTPVLIASAVEAAKWSGKDLVGATIQLRTQPWSVNGSTVAAWNPSSRQLTLGQPTTYPIGMGDGYVLQDKLWMLDQPGEFFHDVAGGTIYLYPADPTLDLNQALVEASVRATALTVRDRSGIQVSGISTDMCSASGLSVQNSPGATVAGVSSAWNGNAGIEVQISAARAVGRTTIRDSAFQGNSLYGINATNAPNTDILSNTVTDTGMAAVGNSLAAIWAGDAAKVSGNVIRRVAYIGIRFSGTGASSVSDNTVSDYCLRLSDCGAIYTWNGPKNAIKTSNQSALVEGNRIFQATPAVVGSPVTGGTGVVAGVYLDDYSMATTVRNNTLFGMPYGVFVHNGSRHIVDTNRILATTQAALWVSGDDTAVNYAYGNTFTNNRLMPVAAATGAYPAPPALAPSHALRYWNTLANHGPQDNGETFVNNRILLTQGQSLPEASITIAGATTDLSANTWRVSHPLDQVVAAPTELVLYKPDLGSELVANGTFDNDKAGRWTSWFDPLASGGQAVLAASLAGCTGPCMKFASASLNDSLVPPTFAMRAGVPHLLQYSVGLIASGAVPLPYIARAVSPWDSFVRAPWFSLMNVTQASAGESLRYEALFTPTSGDPANLNMKATPGVPLAIDNVSLRELRGYGVARAADSIAVAYGGATGSQVIDCPSLGWPAGCSVMDVDFAPVTLPRTLNAKEMLVLVRKDSPWRR